METVTTMEVLPSTNRREWDIDKLRLDDECILLVLFPLSRVKTILKSKSQCVYTYGSSSSKCSFRILCERERVRKRETENITNRAAQPEFLFSLEAKRAMWLENFESLTWITHSLSLCLSYFVSRSLTLSLSLPLPPISLYFLLSNISNITAPFRSFT